MNNKTVINQKNNDNNNNAIHQKKPATSHIHYIDFDDKGNDIDSMGNGGGTTLKKTNVPSRQDQMNLADSEENIEQREEYSPKTKEEIILVVCLF